MDNENVKKKILMIEDDDFLRNLYCDKLRKEGYQLLEAKSGVEGINKIKNENPDLVILDILLPMKSGFDILEEMNETGMISEIPVIVLSNLKQEGDIEESRRLGVRDYFIKADSSFSDFLASVKENI